MITNDELLAEMRAERKAEAEEKGEHCNVFSGDHQHCMHADGGECICPCDGCEAAGVST